MLSSRRFYDAQLLLHTHLNRSPRKGNGHLKREAKVVRHLWRLRQLSVHPYFAMEDQGKAVLQRALRVDEPNRYAHGFNSFTHMPT